MLRLTADLVAVMRILCIYAFPGGGPRGSDSNPVSEKKAAHAAAATVLRDLLMSNGGVYIKIGQHIGTMAHLLPEEYVRAMAGLFEHTTPTPWADVKQCLEHEFGPVDSVFRWISQTPIASASLAQVHEAIDLNGKKV
jgi:aarF domain-containing kinase